MAASLYSTRSMTGSQCRDLSNGWNGQQYGALHIAHESGERVLYSLQAIGSFFVSFCTFLSNLHRRLEIIHSKAKD